MSPSPDQSSEEVEKACDGKEASLKVARDGVSTHWKPFRSISPFFSGGKLHFLSGGGREEGSGAACVLDGRLCVVDMASVTKEVKEVKATSEEEVSDEVLCFCVAPNGKDVVTASRSLLLRHWSLETTECVRSIKGHRMPVLSMAYDSTSTLVATGSADRMVRVWDIPRGYCTHSFKFHTDVVPFVLFHPDPHRLQLFSAAEDSTVKVYDLVDSKCVGDFREHMSQVTSVALTEDGYTAASVGRDKVINFYDLRTMSHLKTIAVMEELEAAVILPRDNAVAMLGELSADNRKRKISATSAHGVHVLVAGGDKGVLRFFQFSLKAHDKSSFQVEPLLQVSVASGVVLSSSDNFSSPFGVKSIDFLTKSSELAVTTADNAIVFFKIGESTSSVLKSSQVMGSFDEILDIALIREESTENDKEEHEEANAVDNLRVAVVSNSPQVQILNNKSETVNLLGHEDIVLSVDCSPSGRWLVTSSKDRTCRVWDTQSCLCVGLAEGHSDAVSCVALSQRNSTYTSKMAAFFSGGGDKVLKRWSFNSVLAAVHSAEKQTSLPVRVVSSHSVRAHDKDINSVAVAPNDSLVASGSQDSKIRLWTASDLSPVATLSGHKRSVWRVCFSPVDKCLASCSGDRTVKLWSLADYSCLRTFQGHSASVLCVKFVNNGMQLMSGASDGLVNLWTIRTGELQNTFDHHQDKVWSIEVVVATSTTDNAGVFLSGGSDSNLIFWSDCTVQEENTRLKAIEDKMLLDQKLGNDIRHKRYKQALQTALELKYVAKILEIFRAILEDNEMKLLSQEASFSFESVQFVFDEYVTSWSPDDLLQVMSYLKEWNTNSRNSYVVNVVLTSIIRLIGIEELSRTPTLADALAGISAYSDRHFQRIDKLHEATYLLEYINSEMSVLADNSMMNST